MDDFSLDLRNAEEQIEVTEEGEDGREQELTTIGLEIHAGPNRTPGHADRLFTERRSNMSHPTQLGRTTNRDTSARREARLPPGEQRTPGPRRGDEGRA